MTIPFGPQLIGETEKTLNALLRRSLEAPGLTEPQWVTLRLADLLDGTVDNDGLAAAVASRAHFDDAHDLVHELTDRGLIGAGRLTPEGRDTVHKVQDATKRSTAPIWSALPDEDVAAATRVLNDVLTRAHKALQTA
jgi:Helix-turn-helix family